MERSVQPTVMKDETDRDSSPVMSTEQGASSEMEQGRIAGAHGRIPAPGGLRIDRYFTEPGAHPFDSTEWELRDPRIGHGDRIAFEPRHRQLPKSWYQAATHHRAPQELRGPPGTPTR